RDSPLDLDFTSDIIQATVFPRRNTVELREGSTAMRLRIEVGSNRGIDPAISTLLSPGVNLSPMGGTRIMGRGERSGQEGAESLVLLTVHLTGDELGTDFSWSIEDGDGNVIKSGDVMGHEFLIELPGKLARGARSLLALKAVFGAELPGHVLPFVSRDGVKNHIERQTGDPGFSEDIADRLQQMLG
ncbi:MAG: hypothetical protein ACYTFG_06105, partial [Planctomycetota bacterium]